MAENSKIEWTDATWNPATGCELTSPGCTNCYAMRLAGTRLRHLPSRAGLTTMTKAGPVWNGEVRLNYDWLDQPLRWTRSRRIFVCAHGDLFHEAVPDLFILRVWQTMAAARRHTFQILTKRSRRMLVLAGSVLFPPLPNVWLGVSVENQEWADIRIPDLLATPSAVRFVSCEPLLGPIDLALVNFNGGQFDALRGGDVGVSSHVEHWPKLAWVIVGGESGPKARPMHPNWARSLRDQCVEAGVPFFFKQWGEWVPYKPNPGGDLAGDVRADRVRIVHPSGRSDVEVFKATGGHNTELGSRYMIRLGKKAAGRLLDGREWSESPA